MEFGDLVSINFLCASLFMYYNLAIVYLGHHCINSSAVDLLHLHEEHEEHIIAERTIS